MTPKHISNQNLFTNPHEKQLTLAEALSGDNARISQELEEKRKTSLFEIDLARSLSFHKISNKYLDWGAGPRAGQFLIMAAKCNAILSGKYSPDIEDIQEVAPEILRHRLVRNFKAEADGVTIDEIIKQLF